MRPSAPTRISGQSGRRYVIEHIFQDKPGDQGRAYLATCIAMRETIGYTNTHISPLGLAVESTY
jgi:hypothetical protein